MKVLICGGGCAGPALAFWLARLGHNVTIVERYPDLRAAGAQIDLRAQGITAVRRMGLLETIRANTVAEEGMSMVDVNGKLWARMMANRSGKGAQGPTSEFEIMRGDLVRILYEATKDTVKYVFGVSVDHFEQDDEKVTAFFSDGSQDTFDLLVGADGQGSRIRKAIIPDNIDPVVRTGMHIAYSLIPRIPTDTNMCDVCHVEGGRIMMRRSHTPAETQAYFMMRDPRPEVSSIHRASEAEQKEFWAQKYRGAGWQADRFIEEIDKSSQWYCSEVLQIRVDRWHKGRVVLLGDAAHCASPMSGMGTTGAFIGAYVLAGELSKSPSDLTQALVNYEKTLRPFVNDIQNISFTGLKVFTPMTKWGISMLHWVLWLTCFLKIPELAMRFSSEEEGGWKLPEYDEMQAAVKGSQ